MIRKYPAIFLLPVIIVGIIIADLSRLPAWIFFALLLISIGIGLYLFNRNSKNSSIIVLSLALLFFCSFHFSIRYYDNGRTHISNYTEGRSRYKIYGKISDWPDIKLNITEIKVKIDSISNRSISMPAYGNILLKITDTTTSFQRGDKIIFSGRIYPVRHEGVSEKFDYQRYLNLKDIFGIVYLPTPLEIVVVKTNQFSIFRLTDKLRTTIRNSFFENLSSRSASIASGFFIGETRDIDPEIYNWFKNSGTLHLLAVSGSNVGLVLIFFIILLRPFSLSRNKRSLILIAVVILFSLLSYGEPSVMRASIMACLVLSGSLLERKYNLNQIIAATACIILLLDPAQLYDVGFQLSFVIAWGLIYTVPQISSYFAGFETKLWYKLFVYTFIITLTAQIYSIGLVGLYFNQIPVLSPLVNLIIVPLVSISVVGILLLLLLNLIAPILALWFGGILDLLFQIIIYFVDMFGNQKAVLLKVYDWNIWWVIVSYFLLFLLVKAIKSNKTRRLLAIASLLLLNIYLLNKFIISHRQNSHQMSLFSIPGGIVSLIEYESTADMIITGIIDREYKIEEKIIYPKLEELEIKNIKRLFVLSADYSAIDDLLRLMVDYKVDSIYLNNKLINSFIDHLNNFSMIDSINILPLTSFSDSLSQSGIYSKKNGLRILLNDQKEVVFLNKIDIELFKRKFNNNLTYLVIGQNWNVNWQNLIDLYHSGYDKIITNKLDFNLDTQSLEQQNITKQISSNLIVDLQKVQLYQF